MNHRLTGWSTLLPCIDCTLSARAMVSWARLHRVLRCNHIKIISSLSWISYAKSAPLGVARRWSTQVFVINDIRRGLLYVSIYCVIYRSNSNGCTRRATRSANKYMPTNEMGICDAIQWNINIGVWITLGHRQSECQHTISGECRRIRFNSI